MTHSKHQDNQKSDGGQKRSSGCELKVDKCIRTPCYLEGYEIFGLVDAGATHSFLDEEWAKKHDIEISPVEGKIVQCMQGSEIPRVGLARNLHLENGNKNIVVNLEVAKLSGGEKLILGLDLFKSLNFQLLNVPFTWPRSDMESGVVQAKNIQHNSLEDREGIPEDGIVSEWKEVLEENQK